MPVMNSFMPKNKIRDILALCFIFSLPLALWLTSGLFVQEWKEITAQGYLAARLIKTAAILMQNPFLRLLGWATVFTLAMFALRLTGGWALWFFRVRLIGTLSDRISRGVRITAGVLLTGLLTLSGSVFLIPAIGRPAGPNIILIGADTLRAGHLGCYGYARDTSPNIDGLAAEGVVFKQAFSHVASTTPAFATILTSKVPMSHGVLCNTNRGYRLEKRHTTLAERLKDRGYLTAAFTSGFSLKKSSGLDQGFDVFNDDFAVERRADQVNRDVFRWLEDNRNRKFFLFVHYFDPHGKYRPPSPYDELFPYTQKEFDIERIAPYQRYDGISDPSFYISLYDGEIRYMDEHIGRLLRKLEDLGLTRDTVIVFTADHGETLDDHKWWFEHGHYVYDEQIHIPLVVWYPDAFKPAVTDALVTHVDIVPTILDLLGLESGPGIEGHALTGLIQGEPWPKTRMYAESHHGWPGIRDGDELEGLKSKHFALRCGRWKLIRIPKATGIHFELYQIHDDPGELNNLIGRHPEVERRLKAELMDFIDQYQRTDYYIERVGHPTEKRPTLSEDQIEALRSLGYLQ